MTAILGISAFYHDSAAALVIDGRIVAASQEERFSRVKHDHRFPQQAVDNCLAQAGIGAKDLDYVGFYDKPLTKFDRLLETALAYVPRGYRVFRRAMPLWLHHKLHLPREMRRALRGEYPRRFVFTDHHESHAASAFFPSPFQAAAILTADGVGEWSTTCIGHGRGNRIELTAELTFPHSLGLLYSAFTAFAGFRVNSGEYKLMGLAPYGEPRYRELILDRLLDLKSDGSFRLDMSYFDFGHALTMTSRKFERLFGGPPRHPEAELTEREMDLAASIQAVTEEVMLRMARHAHRQTGSKQLVLAGGVALNSVANGRILREGPFDQIWIQPAAGDAGGAIGTALFIWHQLLDQPRDCDGNDQQHGSLLGPAFADDQIATMLNRLGATYTTCHDDDEFCVEVADLLAQDQVVGWFQGRMEFGPRALGSRSILADPRTLQMRDTLNRKIKFRESFRPFAPIVLREQVHEYFDIRPDQESPYMLLVAPVRNAPSNEPPESSRRGLERLQECRGRIPAVTHVDGSARVQTVDQRRHPLLHQLLCQFRDKTGCPVLINTSFNVRSEPIVCTPEDAYRCFLMTDLDILVMGRHVLRKSDQPAAMSDPQRQQHLAQFPAD